jgi:hypothetical protein
MKTKDKRQKTKDSWILKTSLFLIMLLGFSACRTTKTLSKPTLKSENPVAQVISQVQKAQPQFKTANVSKMSMALEMGDRKVNVSASCKIKKDSLLYLSIQPFLGIEMFKAEFTTDSIRVFDKMNRRYYVADYSYFRNRFGVDADFYSLQALLTARFFCVGNKAILADSCKLITSPQGLNRIEFDTKNMIQSTDISAQNLIQQILLKSVTGNYSMQTTYSDYSLQNGVNFPQNISLKIEGLNTVVSCDFSILRVEFDTDLKFIPTNPANFTRADLDLLLKK